MFCSLYISLFAASLTLFGAALVATVFGPMPLFYASLLGVAGGAACRIAYELTRPRTYLGPKKYAPSPRVATPAETPEPDLPEQLPLPLPMPKHLSTHARTVPLSPPPVADNPTRIMALSSIQTLVSFEAPDDDVTRITPADQLSGLRQTIRLAS